MRRSFDRTSRPPALLLELTLSDLTGRFRATRMARVDTGAARSAIPASVVVDLRLNVARSAMARGAFDTTNTLRPMFYLQCSLDGRQFHMMEAFHRANETVLLGSDILARYTLCADGPGGDFKLGTPGLLWSLLKRPIELSLRKS